MTDRLTRDLMFEAVPYSAVNMLLAWEICEPEHEPEHHGKR